MGQKKLFHRDFIMVVIGQIISLFGNQVLRYALPLYLLNRYHSAGLFSLVTACSFLPMVILSPIGGIIADRVNKRNVMVCLDTATAVLVLTYTMLYQRVNLVMLLVVTLMLLYGIQGAYQPTVQASIPLLVEKDRLMQGNAVINLVGSLSSLVGPVLGGILFSVYGILPVLILSFICFVISAVMEVFIHIPFERRIENKNVFEIVKMDMKDSIEFICKKQKILSEMSILIAVINVFFSSAMMIGLPVIINEHLGFSLVVGNRLYGYAEGILAVGGLLGGVIAGALSKRFHLKRAYIFIVISTVGLLGIALADLFFTYYQAYIIIVASGFFIMICSTIFSIQIMVAAQKITPSDLLGKVMALVTSLAMCATPVGQLFYGFLFERFSDRVYLIFLLAFGVCFIISIFSYRTMQHIPKECC